MVTFEWKEENNWMLAIRWHKVKINFFFNLAQDLNIQGWSGRRTCGEDREQA